MSPTRNGLSAKHAGRRLKVELVGLFPDFYRLCPRGCDWMKGGGLNVDADQLRDYPPAVQEAGRKLQEIYESLMRDFHDVVVPVSVGLLSARGFWLALRHRLDSRQMYVIVGERAIPVSAGYGTVQAAVRGVLAMAV
ncbi:MAG TPA: hypothetical protein VF282_08880 [Bacillota bacterium]